MKLSEFATILAESNLQLAYKAYQQGKVPALPYLVYYETNPILNTADNHLNHRIKTVIVELVFERKDEKLEERLEELWNVHKLFYEVLDENYIDTERLYVKSYSVYLY